MNKITEGFLQAIKLVADEKKVPRDAVADVLKDAIVKAYVKERDEEMIEVEIDLDNKIFNINQIFTIVEDNEDLNDYCEISVQNAKKYLEQIGSDQTPILGEKIKKPIDLESLDKKIISHIIQIFKQGITVQGNLQIYSKWKDHVGEVIKCEVERSDRHGSLAKLEENEYGFIGLAETIPGETLVPGEKYNFSIKEVKQQSAGWPVILSRADVNLVKHLLKVNVPEIQDGIIEIKDIQRIAGFKTKVSLISHQPGVEPCGTVIGPHGSRVQAISNELHGEKLDVFEYSDDFERYLVDVCSPAKIVGYDLTTHDDGKKELVIIVRADQMPLLIGKKGANIRLISMLLAAADIDVKTPEDAKAEKISYKTLEVKSMRERKFARAYERNSMPGNGDFSGFVKPSFNKQRHEKPVHNNSEQQNRVEHAKPNLANEKFSSYQRNDASFLKLEDQMAKFNINMNEMNEVDAESNNQAKPVVETKTNVEQPTKEVVDTIAKPASAKKTNLFDKLKANEDARISAGGETVEQLEQKTTAKPASSKKTTKFSKAKKTTNKNTESTKSKTSILDELASGDRESLMNELKKEIDNFESQQEDNDSDIDETYYDDKDVE